MVREQGTVSRSLTGPRSESTPANRGPNADLAPNPSANAPRPQESPEENTPVNRGPNADLAPNPSANAPRPQESPEENTPVNRGPNADLAPNPSANAPSPPVSDEENTPVNRGPNADLAPNPNDRPINRGPNADLAPNPSANAPRAEEESGGFFSGFTNVITDTVDGIQERINENRVEREAQEEQVRADAQVAYTQFNEDPEALNRQLSEEGIGSFNEAERLAIAQFSGENESVGVATSEAVVASINDYETFDDIPTDIGSQILIDRYSGEEQAEQIGGLLQDHFNTRLEAEIERHGEHSDGDDQADGAIEDLLRDAERIAETHPALAPHLEATFNGSLEDSAELIHNTRRNDDPWYADVGHFVSGGVRWTAGAIGDGLRAEVGRAADGLEFISRTGGDVLSFTVEAQGNAAAAAFDAVGLDQAADVTRQGTELASDGIQFAADTHGRVQHDLTIGFGEGAVGLVDGVGEVIANPVGTVIGVAEVARALDFNPVTLAVDTVRNGGDVQQTLRDRQETLGNVIDGVTAGYRETNDEHGTVAAVGHIGFDVLTTIGTGGSTAAGRTATTVASRLGRFGPAVRSLDDVARLGDDAVRLGDDAARLGDDAARLGDDAVRLDAPPTRPERWRRELTDDELRVQNNANSQVDNNLDELVQAYENEFGRKLDLDDARELFDDFAESPASRAEYGTAVHGASARVIDELFDRRLAEPVPPGTPRPEVVFTAGGSGSGKSSITSVAGQRLDDADFIVDSTLAKYETAQSRISQVLDSGRDVNISFVYRDPVEAFVEGVLPRAAETGRIVPIEAFAAIHNNVRTTIGRLADEFGDSGRFSLDIYHNRTNQAPRVIDNIDDLPVSQVDNLTETLYGHLDEAFNNGQISREVYDAFLRERPPT